MGGRVKKGYVVIGGVVKDEVKEFFDILVDEGKFESRSKAIGYVLTEFMKHNQQSWKNESIMLKGQLKSTELKQTNTIFMRGRKLMPKYAFKPIKMKLMIFYNCEDEIVIYIRVILLYLTHFSNYFNKILEIPFVTQKPY